MKLAGLLGVLAAASGGAVATLQANASCMANWKLIPGDYCAPGLACVGGGWGYGSCTPHSCSTTLATSTSTVYAPTQTIHPATAKTTVFSTTTQGTWCNCPPYVIFTTTATVSAAPTATQPFWYGCQAGQCEKGLECIDYGTYKKCYVASCVNPGLPAPTTTVTPTKTSAAVTSTLTATVTSRIYTSKPGDPVCSCVGGPPTSTSTSYIIVATPAP